MIFKGGKEIFGKLTSSVQNPFWSHFFPSVASDEIERKRIENPQGKVNH